MLVEHFARQVAVQNGWKPSTFTPEAVTELQKYSWPGNVRELRNVVERVLLLSPSATVDIETVRSALPLAAPTVPAGVTAAGPLAERVNSFERETILVELKRHGHHITNTAKALGLERSYLYKKCQQLGIDLQALRSEE